LCSIPSSALLSIRVSPTPPYPLSLHDALPILAAALLACVGGAPALAQKSGGILRLPAITSPASMSIHEESTIATLGPMMGVIAGDRKSTRLNSSHEWISYAVFCLKKKNIEHMT